MNIVIFACITVSVIAAIVVTGRKNNNEGSSTNGTISKDGYEIISAKEAKSIMDSNADIVVIDVRTENEFSQGHINGAINIPVDDIASKAGVELKDKNQKILVYCRSGVRSKKASKQLVDMGYTNVSDFGGIIDWPYETVK